MWPLCYVTFFHLNNYLGDFHVSAPIFTFLFLMVAEYFIVLIYYHFFHRYPIGYIWFFYVFFLLQTMPQFLWVCLENRFLEVECLDQRACFICEEESLNGTPAGFCLFLLPPLPLSNLSWDFHFFLLFYNAYTFLSYMCGKYVPKLIFYLWLFVVFFIVQMCLIFREPNCLVLGGF